MPLSSSVVIASKRRVPDKKAILLSSSSPNEYAEDCLQSDGNTASLTL